MANNTQLLGATLLYCSEKVKYPNSNCNYNLQDLDLKKVAEVILDLNLDIVLISMHFVKPEVFKGLELELVKKIQQLHDFINS
jgi:hypothetical protein